mgnify:FL=1
MTTKTIEKICLLREVCKVAGDPSACTRLCPHYIRIHGHKGEGGRVGIAGIPRDYRNITVGNSPIRQAQPEVYRQIDAYIRTFSRQFDPNGPRIKSLYLYSDATGTGKTTTACAILNEYLIRHYVGSLQRGTNPEPRPVYFLNFNQWQSRFNAANRKHVDELQAKEASRIYYGMFDAAKAASLLVIDDIGVRDASDAFRGDAHDLIDHRVTNRMPTVYTSNVTVDELAQVYDRRLWDRVRDMTGVIRFDGESRRGMRREDR